MIRKYRLTKDRPVNPDPPRPKRGYLSGTPRGAEHMHWRQRVLREHPMCQVCNAAPSTELDHIRPISLGGRFGRENMQALCRECHMAKSREESRLRAAIKKNPTIAPIDGWRRDAK